MSIIATTKSSAAVILGSHYGGAGITRNSINENPSGSQQDVKGQSRFVSDTPGITMRAGDPKASLKGSTYGVVFVAGEYNKKTGQLSQNVAYYGVILAYGKDGKIDSSKSTVRMISRDEFIKAAKAAGGNVPKDKSKKECPECLLSPPNRARE